MANISKTFLIRVNKCIIGNYTKNAVFGFEKIKKLSKEVL